MKTVINKFKCVLVGLFILTIISSCEKEEEEPNTNNAAKAESRTFSNTIWAYSSPYHYLDLSVPELTADNINSAAVMVYFSTVEGTWRAIPFTQYTPTYNYFMNFTTSAGSVRVTWVYNTTLSAGDDPNQYYGTNVKFKAVVISAAANALKPNINYYNYEEIKEAFHLKD